MSPTECVLLCMIWKPKKEEAWARDELLRHRKKKSGQKQSVVT